MKKCKHKGLFRELEPKGEDEGMQCINCGEKFYQNHAFWRDEDKVKKLYVELKKRFGDT